MDALIILNDAPYGSERTYNGVRLALSLLKADPKAQVCAFLMGDAVLSAKTGQKTPEGYYNLERMLRRFILGNGSVLLCGTCLAARGIVEDEIVEGARPSTMDALAEATGAAEKVLVF